MPLQLSFEWAESGKMDFLAVAQVEGITVVQAWLDESMCDFFQFCLR